MSKVLIEGGNSLVGTVAVSGAKNSVLKIIAASLFSNEDIVLENVPNIGNVTSDLEIIEALGGEYEWVRNNCLRINCSGIDKYEIPFDLGSKYRTASLYAAALVYRFGKAVVPKPGGCKIGYRPINRLFETWKSLGVEVAEDERNFYLQAMNLKPSDIDFNISTHMGTDNAVLFSMFISGDTTIRNAAEEPEVDDLISFINMIGGEVERAEPRIIKVVGKNRFTGGTFKIMPDRNEVVTFAVAALVTNGNIVIKNVIQSHLLAFTNVLSKVGCRFEFNNGEMRVWRKRDSLQPVDITTAPYPGFMTDWQPLIALLLTQAEGESMIHDIIYTDRFEYTKDLNSMGAKITLHKPSELGLDVVVSDDLYDLEKLGEPFTVAKIKGPSKLKGVKVNIPDLRAGATLVLAALMADGKSEIYGFENVSRGYENLIEKLHELGAVIEGD